ncbi:MAG: response regulator transcription factor [Cyanobacteria bacterium]|nr:response regulator transcription factor [Cyanobacteriota bacterium]
MSRMLLGETQRDLSSAVEEYFSLSHYTVQVETHGLRILECLQQKIFDVAILEIALFEFDAIRVVTAYRAAGGSAPILLTAGKHSSEELQRGLDSGADAYVVKPFKLADLAAQVRALLRRPSLCSGNLLITGDIAMNTVSGTVTKNDEVIHLHPMEFKLLQFLLSHPNQVFSSHAILERVWQKPEQLEDTVRTHIRTLRQKIDSPGNQSIITTVRGLGYKTDVR